VSQTIVLVADHKPVRMRERVKRLRKLVGDGPPIVSLPSLWQMLRFFENTLREFKGRRPRISLFLDEDMPPVTITLQGLTSNLTSENLIRLLQCYEECGIGRSAVFLPSADPASEFSLRWIDPEEREAPPKSGPRSLRPAQTYREAAAS
jgi:hypothetical protein